MKNYITYSPNGEILRTGQCLDDDLTLQGELVMEGVADDTTQYIEDGQVVDMPTKPAGEYRFDFEMKQWQANPDSQVRLIRTKRDLLLAQSDWTDTVSAQTRLGMSLYTAWQEYRQALRDIPLQAGYPFEITWPTPPQ